ncbi:TonB-dependent receptor [methane-oxidizing endosymbiont of Gigantopelta aegis]|uniref:TonB-dependent receptor n=1 Tax=methane-oxidizing endosymbiont of Gigantopelta aegis TaxID=2794938 RepID=UPI0018DDF0EC|nr:TonB-dependent receptor [methane-oxidizing endosymbiont of Gigantopelta aegis]
MNYQGDRKHISQGLLLLLFISTSVYAEPEHVQTLDALVIHATPPQAAETALPVSMLSGDELRMKASSTLGETLQNEPGISSQSFGPGVGQPVIRGQSGARVQVLQNSLSSLDVSSLSPDHANSTESLWAEKIEVLKGPATLLYSSGAIGGVVNVLDNRIPDMLPEKALQGAIEQRYNTVNEGKSTAFKLEGRANQLAWHLDGFYRDSINLRIPGYAINGQANSSQGRLQNSNTRARSGTAGFSWVGDNGFVGVSVNHLNNNYGIPPAEEAASVRIAMQQTRYEMKSAVNSPFAFAEKLRIQLGYNDYQHTELEGGAASNVYKQEGFSSRLELVQKPWAIFDHGVVGVQTRNSRFSAIGAEAIVPASDINGFSWFTMQDIHTEYMTYELGLRVEQQWISPENLPEKSHTPVSFSAAAIWNVSEEDSVTLTFTRSQRAPGVQELFSDGPHLATQSYDRGNANLIEETSHNLELGLHIDHEKVQADINLYQNWVQDYITQISSGQFFDLNNEIFITSCTLNCLPVFNTQQRDAEFQGFEAQINLRLADFKNGSLNTQGFADYVRGRFSGGGDVPRMPPLRYGMALSWRSLDWMADMRITRAEKQNHPGLNEAETAGYWLLNLAAQYQLNAGDDAEIKLFVNANNLLDQDIRHSVSYLRQFAPEPGRGVAMGVRVTF